MSKDIQYIKLDDLFEQGQTKGKSFVSRIDHEKIGKVGLEFPNPSIEIIEFYNSDRPGVW